MYINSNFFKYYTGLLLLLSVIFIYKKVEIKQQIIQTVKRESILSSDIIYIYNPKSKFTIIEYSDLNCIHCKNLNSLIEENKSKLINVSIYKRNLAFVNNGESPIKTLYGNCLRSQTSDDVWLQYEKLAFARFEERYHDKVFLNIAKSLLKDNKAFYICIENKSEIDKLLKGRETAIVNGIKYIPTILVIKDDILIKKIDGYTAPGMYSFIEFYNK